MNCPQCDRWEHQGYGIICSPCGHTHSLGPCLPPRGCTCGTAHWKLGWHPVDCEYFKEKTRVPDITGLPHAVIGVEELRNFIIKNAVVITSDHGKNIDAVPLTDLVDFYEKRAHRDFYKGRASVKVEDDGQHTFAPSNDA